MNEPSICPRVSVKVAGSRVISVVRVNDVSDSNDDGLLHRVPFYFYLSLLNAAKFVYKFFSAKFTIYNSTLRRGNGETRVRRNIAITVVAERITLAQRLDKRLLIVKIMYA